jgi:uncharacterized membrane protein
MPENRAGGMNDVQFQNQIQEIIQTSYINGNKFYVHGGLACIYFLASISTFLTGLAAFFERSMDDKSMTTGTTTTTDLKLDPFTLVLPIIVFIFDCDMRRVYRRREKYTILPVKLLFWAFFYLIIILAGNQTTNL